MFIDMLSSPEMKNVDFSSMRTGKGCWYLELANWFLR